MSGTASASKKLSGSQFRKRAKEQDEKTKKLMKQIPKLNTFFVSPAFESSAPSTSTTSSTPSNQPDNNSEETETVSEEVPKDIVSY